MAVGRSTPQMVLASQSPRRAELLREARIPFDVVASRHDEPDAAGWRYSPAEFAESASYYKARSVADECPDRLILAADTVVALSGRLYGKPADEAEARRILSTLAGTTHEVITGVTLLWPAAGRRLIRHAVTRVTMRRLSPQELDGYIAGGQWQGKAGAYGIQDKNDAFVECTEGSFSNVVGLPLELVRDMLTEFGAAA